MAGHRLKHELDVPLVSTFHTLARVKAETGDPEPERRVQAEHDVIDCSDAITASCTAEAQQLVALYGAAPDRIELVPPGVIHAFFSPGDRSGPARRSGTGSTGRRCCSSSAASNRSRVSTSPSARSASCAASTRSSSSSGGPSGPDGEAEAAKALLLADELGVADRIRWVEPQPHHLLSTYYRAADVCVVPSRSESFGLVALEAAACGTPVVAAAVGGLRTLVEHGETGLLVEERQPDGVRSRRRRSCSPTRRKARAMSRGRRDPGAWLHVVHDRGAAAPPLRRPHRPPAGRLHCLTRRGP